MDVVKLTREEIETVTAELRIKAALNARLPQASNFDLSLGQRARVYRELRKRFEGPLLIVLKLGKPVWVSYGGSYSSLAAHQS